MASMVSVRVPIWLTFHQYGIPHSGLYPLLESLGIGHKKIVTYQLHLVSNELSKFFPTVPIVLVQAILYGQDGVLVCPILPILWPSRMS